MLWLYYCILYCHYLLWFNFHISLNVIYSLHIRSSSQSDRPIRNIHIANDNGCFTVYVYVFLPLSLPRSLPDLIVYTSYMAGVLKEAGTAYPSRAPEYTPSFLGGRVAHLFSFMCCPIMCLYVLSVVL
jgi:hypothetical protein